MPVLSAGLSRRKPVKALIFGASGVGKTHLTLSATPDQVLIFDAESGADFFEGKEGFSFDYWVDDEGLKTASVRQLNKAIDFLESDAGSKKYKTFIIDPISDIYDLLQAQRSQFKDETSRKKGYNPDKRNESEMATFNQKDWADIKRIYKAIILRLKNLPQNVFLIAREKEVTETKPDGSLVRTGIFTYEGEKNTHYAVDFCIRIVKEDGERKAIVIKSRSDMLPEDTVILNPSFKMFDKIASISGKQEKIATATNMENAFMEEENDASVVSEYHDKLLTLFQEVKGKGDECKSEAVLLFKAYDKKGNPKNITDLDTLKEIFEKLELINKGDSE